MNLALSQAVVLFDQFKSEIIAKFPDARSGLETLSFIIQLAYNLSSMASGALTGTYIVEIYKAESAVFTLTTAILGSALVHLAVRSLQATQ